MDGQIFPGCTPPASRPFTPTRYSPVQTHSYSYTFVDLAPEPHSNRINLLEWTEDYLVFPANGRWQPRIWLCVPPKKTSLIHPYTKHTTTNQKTLSNSLQMNIQTTPRFDQFVTDETKQSECHGSHRIWALSDNQIFQGETLHSMVTLWWIVQVKLNSSLRKCWMKRR